MQFEIIPNTEEVKKEFMEFGWGNSDVILEKHELERLIDVLKDGHCIGLFDGEYTTIIRLKGENENE